MAVTKVNPKEIKSAPITSLLDIRSSAQQALSANPNDATAKANLNAVNKELGKDLKLSSNVVGLLDNSGVTAVSTARSNLETGISIPNVPANAVATINKSLDKNVKTTETQIFSTLTKVQDAEIAGLRAQGASKDVINAAIAENAIERASTKTALANPGYQRDAVTRNDNGFVLSNNTAFANDAAGQRVVAAMNAGYGLLDDLNLSQQYKKGETTYGSNLYKLGVAAQQKTADGFVVTPELQKRFESPRSAPQLVKYLNAIDAEQANPVLSKNAKVIGTGEKDGVRYEVLTDTIKSGIKGGAEGTFVRFLDPANVAGQNVSAGTVQYLNATTHITPTGDQNWLGKILSIVGSIVTPFNPLLGSALVAGGSFSQGGDFGDVLKAVALNYVGYRAGAYVGSQLGLGTAPSFADDITASANLLTNPIDELTAVANGIKDAAKAVGSTVYDLVTDPATVIDDFATRVRNSPIGSQISNPAAVSSPDALENIASNVLPGATPRPTTGTATDGRVVVTGTMPPLNPGEITGGLIGSNVAPTVDVTATRPEPTPPNLGGLLTPTPATTPTTIEEQAPPVEVVERSKPVIPTPNPSFLDTVRNVSDIAQEYAPPAILALSLLNQTPVPTGVGNEKLPAWVFDPAMSGVIPRIQAAQAAMPAPMPNLFNAEFQRGGLGAGQFIGYDLLNRTGDIPAQTLLGVSPLAMPPMNLLGVTGGQAPASQASLV